MILTFIDTETTGLDVLQHEIIEIGMLRVEVDRSLNYGQIECYEAKIKPRYIKRASPQALKINGYTSQKWKHAIKPHIALKKIKDWVESSDYVVGQNLIFDYGFINKCFDDLSLERPAYPKYYDTKHMAQALVTEGKIKRTALDYLCENYKIPSIGRAHTALVDVFRTFELFKKMRLDSKPIALTFSKPYNPFEDKNDGSTE